MEPTYKFISPIKCYNKYFNTEYEDNIESAYLCILNNAYKVCSLHIGDCITRLVMSGCVHKFISL